jgi:exosome complex component RRP41
MLLGTESICHRWIDNKNWRTNHSFETGPITEIFLSVHHSKISMVSIRRTDLLALANLRNDGRKPHEVRRMNAVFGEDGVVQWSQGLTCVQANVLGPTDCLRKSDERNDRAIVQVELRVVPFAGNDRRIVSSTDRRMVQATTSLQAALEATILLDSFPRKRIIVELTVLQDDGSRYTASLNAATLALLERGIPMKDMVCACTAASSSQHLVDLNRAEELDHADRIQCAILPQRGTIVWAQSEASAQEYKIFESTLQAGMEGCRAVFHTMQAAIKERVSTLLAAKQGRATVRVVTLKNG